MQPGVKFLWLFLPGVVEVKADVSVEPQPEIVVHDKDLGVVLGPDGPAVAASLATVF